MHFIKILKSVYSVNDLQLRKLYSQTGKWPASYSIEILKNIEKYWKDKVNVDLEKPKDPNAEPYYLLSMFPYPSGRLHMGHVRVYTLSDALARFRFLQGKKVIHPMGWDAFGLPAENAAIESNKSPSQWTWSNISTMKEQLKKLGLNFSWKREVVTCDPSYYRWTQYLFLKMYHRGLAYRKKSMVNWDPVDQTVLADEQVDENGCSWRSGAKVVKRPLTQWFLRTTAFSKELYEGLDAPTLQGWRDIVKIQKNWIGEPSGYVVQLPVEGTREPLASWIRHPHALHGSSHVLLSTRHHLAAGSKPGERLPLTVLHPLTGHPLPVFAAAHPNPLYAPLARIGIPAINKEDAEFAKRNGLPFKQQVIDEDGRMVNSEEVSGLSPEEAAKQVVDELRQKGLGCHQASPRLDDWLISRQRYWGTPIPIVHCPTCQEVPVPYSDLPVILPEVEHIVHKGTSPLASDAAWLHVPCPKCGQPAKRETDTMDTFVDSSWYFLRYLDPGNPHLPFDPVIANPALPVDLYIGGKEHAVLHLYFSRFIWRFLRSEGCLSAPEPFNQFVSLGMVLGKTYRDPESGRCISPSQVVSGCEPPVEKETGQPLEVEWDKMSKSKHNGVEPEEIVDQYGVDFTRLVMLSDITPRTPRKWEVSDFRQVNDWVCIIWKTMEWLIQLRTENNMELQIPTPEIIEKARDFLYQNRNFFLSKILYHYAATGHLNLAINQIRSLFNCLRNRRYITPSVAKDLPEYDNTLATFLVVLHPLAPCITSELWMGFSAVGLRQPSSWYHLDKPLVEQTWPQVDPEFPLPVSVKLDKNRIGEFQVPCKDLVTLSKSEALGRLLSQPEILDQLKAARADLDKAQFVVTPQIGADCIFSSPPVPKKKKSKAAASS